jgi:ubiquinone/menaquinone biosynthesis C-methylase UbiE
MEKTKKFFDTFSKEYEKQSRYKHVFYKWIIKTIFRNISNKKCKILDLGTGNGELSIRLAIKFPESNVIGLDISSGMINQAKKKIKKAGIKNITLVVSPVEKLKTQKIDYIVSSVAFHHIKEKELVLTKIYHCLPKGGKVIIGDWFEPSKQYRKEVDKLRKENPGRTNEFDRSWKQFLSDMTVEYERKHPVEYPVCPTNLKKIMRKVGFYKSRIVKSPLPNFAVLVGIK